MLRRGLSSVPKDLCAGVDLRTGILLRLVAFQTRVRRWAFLLALRDMRHMGYALVMGGIRGVGVSVAVP